MTGQAPAGPGATDQALQPRWLAPAALAPPATGGATPPTPDRPVPDVAPTVWLIPTEAPEFNTRQLTGALLSPDERVHAARLTMPAERRSYTVSHAALRLLLGTCLGQRAPDVPLVRAPCPGCGGPHGRPEVSGSGLHFSLSHTSGLAAIALATVPVGVDVEAVPRPATVATVSRGLHHRERAELAALPAEERAVAFTRVWTRKEAYYKGTGAGMVGRLAETYLGTGLEPSTPEARWVLRDVALPRTITDPVAAADREAADAWPSADATTSADAPPGTPPTPPTTAAAPVFAAAVAYRPPGLGARQTPHAIHRGRPAAG